MRSALKVTSHVARDLLQSARLFKFEHQVVWEYVSNGLQYIDKGTRATVVVTIDPKAKRIQVSDNGRGMLIEDLENYFTMHGENIDRKQGRPGRGHFGTGKSAAFGIGASLTVTTVKAGRRSKVRLTLQDIEATSGGDDIPVQILESELATDSASGTLVEIEGIFLKTLDIPSVVRHIERHIAHWPNATVLVNHHECEFSEPEVARQITHNTKGTEYEEKLGDSTLVIKVSKAPLESEVKGIAILTGNVWHDTTLAGCEHKPFAEYIFGSFEVPSLAADSSNIPAFDMSRSMKLNPQNEVVAETLRFVGVHVESIRRELEREDRERRKTEEQKRLQRQGSKIAELINSHFKEWSAKLKSTIAKTGVGKDLLPETDRDKMDGSKIDFGDQLPAIVAGADQGSEPVGPTEPSNEPRPVKPRVEMDESAPQKLGNPSGGGGKPRRSGGFEVVFEKIGATEKRAKYDRDTRTIIINLEHPRIALEAKGAGEAPAPEDPAFLRMAYEIAFTEYAIVLAQELSTAQYYYDSQDALVELRQTIDDLSKSFALAWAR